MNLLKGLKGRVRRDLPLKRYTTFKIGGRARFFVEPKDQDDLKILLGLAKKYRIPVAVIGAGSNILAGDRGIKGIVVKLSSPYFNKLSVKGNCIEAGSGVWIGRLLSFSRKCGLSGLEFLAGIPATVGGALAMNAGITKERRSIGNIVKSVTVMDKKGNRKVLKRKSIKFSYRNSSLSKYIILSALLNLKKGDRARIGDEIRGHLKYRSLTQDLSGPCAGCVFKNPAGDSAGRLIDLCGLKGKRSGGAGVSLKHANFILNLGGASFTDVIRLMDIIKRKVKNRFKIELVPEITIWRS